MIGTTTPTTHCSTHSAPYYQSPWYKALEERGGGQGLDPTFALFPIIPRANIFYPCILRRGHQSQGPRAATMPLLYYYYAVSYLSSERGSALYRTPVHRQQAAWQRGNTGHRRDGFKGRGPKALRGGSERGEEDLVLFSSSSPPSRPVSRSLTRAAVCRQPWAVVHGQYGAPSAASSRPLVVTVELARYQESVSAPSSA